MIENKPCRHKGTASGHFYKGNCEDCVIERWEACDALVEIRDKQISSLLKRAEKLVEALEYVVAYANIGTIPEVTKAKEALAKWEKGK